MERSRRWHWVVDASGIGQEFDFGVDDFSERYEALVHRSSPSHGLVPVPIIIACVPQAAEGRCHLVSELLCANFYEVHLAAELLGALNLVVDLIENVEKEIGHSLDFG